MATTTAERVRGREREELAQALRQRVSGEVRFDAFTRVLYSTDASIYQMEPVGVVIPRTADDVLAVMEVARESNVPVLPRAGGTSLAGQTVNHAIVMDFSKYMNQVSGGELRRKLGAGATGNHPGSAQPATGVLRLAVRADPTTSTAPASAGASATTPAARTR